MSNNFLLIIDGMTGAGKTTVSDILSRRLSRVAVIGMDKIKNYISDFERGAEDNQIARDVVYAMAKEYFKHDISVVVEHPFKPDDELSRYEDLANEYSAPILKFQLFTTPELAFIRVVNRQKDSDNKIPEERIKRNISLFKNGENDGFMAIDTSEIPSEDVAEKILEKISQLGGE
jgi:predicted ABC-type ATPase